MVVGLWWTAVGIVANVLLMVVVVVCCCCCSVVVIVSCQSTLCRLWSCDWLVGIWNCWVNSVIHGMGCFRFFTILNWLGQQFSLEVIPKILKLSRTSTGIRNQHSFSCSNIKIISLYQTSGTYHHNLIHGQNSGPEFMNRIHGTILTITDRFRRQTGGRNSLRQVR